MAYSKLTLGDKAPEIINTVVEIPKGNHNKYEYDEKLDEIRLDRVLYSSVFYPVDYGFIPETRADDGDHLDVLVIISESVFPGCVVSVKPIGVLDMEDESGRDYKIVAVAEKDPRNKHIDAISDLPDHFKKEVQNFFETYKKLENKWVKIKGWVGKREAYKIIGESKEKFDKELNGASKT
ncbi:MAG: inorganic diphosphatase [Candidatus Microgenomates bacterium]|jgi:inorganic pyrophosphatase